MTNDANVPMRMDLFATVHKGLRGWMGQVGARLGATSFVGPSRDDVLQELGELLQTLQEHALHEDTFIAPLLQERGTDRHLQWQGDHRRLGEAEISLRHQLEALMRLGGDHPVAEAAGTSLYRAFNRFVAETLVHLDYEESVVMPLLWATCTDDELRGVMQRFLDRFGAESAKFHKRVAAAYTQAERARLGL